MAFFADVLGNTATKERIGQLIATHKLPHALLIEGPAGSGKLYFAKRIAAALLCEHKSEESGRNLPCMGCKFCRKVLEDKAPDITYITRGEKTSLGVELIRQAKEDMYLSATEADKKIYIIEDAHTMTVQAQNALLIALEEPPSDVVIILLAESRDLLLTTIRSRVQTVRMGLLSLEELDTLAQRHPALLQMKKSQPDSYREAVLACGGCGGALIALSEKKETNALLARRELIYGLIDAIAKRKGFAEVYECIKSLESKRKTLLEDLDNLLRALRDLALLYRDEQVKLLFYPNREYAMELAEALGGKKIEDMYQATANAISSLDKNANVNLVLSTLAMALVANS